MPMRWEQWRANLSNLAIITLQNGQKRKKRCILCKYRVMMRYSWSRATFFLVMDFVFAEIFCIKYEELEKCNSSSNERDSRNEILSMIILDDFVLKRSLCRVKRKKRMSIVIILRVWLKIVSLFSLFRSFRHYATLIFRASWYPSAVFSVETVVPKPKSAMVYPRHLTPLAAPNCSTRS